MADRQNVIAYIPPISRFSQKVWLNVLKLDEKYRRNAVNVNQKYDLKMTLNTVHTPKAQIIVSFALELTIFKIQSCKKEIQSFECWRLKLKNANNKDKVGPWAMKFWSPQSTAVYGAPKGTWWKKNLETFYVHT